MGGSKASITLPAPSDTTVGDLGALARRELELGAQGAVMLCYEGKPLTDTTLTLPRAGLSNGAELTVVLRRLLRFEEVLYPPPDDSDDSVALEAQHGGQTDYVLAKFLETGKGYRCAVAEPLPGQGRQAVAFDFLHFAPFVAIGLHASPRQMLLGPLGNYGWIGETHGGICLYQGSYVRHNGATVHGRAERPTAGCFSEGMTVVLVVDHEANSISWVVFPDQVKAKKKGKAKEPVVVDAPLPSGLAGRPLSPVVSGTNSTRAVIRVRMEDPRCPSWRGGDDPIE